MPSDVNAEGRGGMPSEEVDALIIGAGQAGKPLSVALAKAGWKTVLVERAHVGGTCVNEGCTPTKTMAASARVAHLVSRAGDYGVRTGSVSVDLGVVRRRKRDIVAAFRGGGEKQIEHTEGLRLVKGEARFSAAAGPHAVEVTLAGGTVERFSAGHIFINVGCRPAVRRIPGLAEVPFLDNASIMELAEAPEHLVILGGGSVAVEFGQMFRRFGSRVTFLQRSGRILTREDEDVAQELQAILEQEGVEVCTGCDVREVAESDGGSIDVIVDVEGERRIVSGSHLLVALGRRPATGALELGGVGIETDERGFVKVNERLETSVPGVYALGDVNGGPEFTHVAYDDFRIVRENLLEGGSRSTRERLVPYTIFTDPQLGRVGLTEEQAKIAGREVLVARLPMRHVARALEIDETRGFMKALVERHTGLILGAAVLGVEGGEVMSVLQTAMLGGLSYQALRDGVFAHPTLAESLNNLFMTLDG